MTTKQMAEVAGVSVDTIARKTKELFPIKSGQGKRTVFTQKEAIEIMSQVRKRNIVELPQNAEELPQNAEDGDLKVAFRFMAEAFNRMTKTTEYHEQRIAKLEETTKERAALLPAPQIKIKDRINLLVRDYANENKIQYGIVWSNLYKEFSYRTNTNPRACASTRSMSIIDYIEIEGMLDTLEAVAADLFARGIK